MLELFFWLFAHLIYWNSLFTRGTVQASASTYSIFLKKREKSKTSVRCTYRVCVIVSREQYCGHPVNSPQIWLDKPAHPPRIYRQVNQPPSRDAAASAFRSLQCPPGPGARATHARRHGPRRTFASRQREVAQPTDFFYIYFITILQKYMVRYKFCKNIHLSS
jgi:hypothetical protein